MMFRETVLPNGLRIAAEIYPDAYTAAFGFFARAGARDETPEESGLSHFLEHMAFKGTASRSAAEVNRQLDALGGHSNAYTSEEQTVYYATVLPKYQDRLVDLLADLMRPVLREEDFEVERKVILEEIAKYDDQPPFGAFERSMEVYFGDHPLGQRILGTAASVAALSVDQMRDYFCRHYAPANLVLAAAGCVDFDALVQQAQRLTDAWEPAPPPPPRGAPGPGCPGAERITPPDAAQAYLLRLSSAPSADQDDRYAMRLLATIVGDESGSRLFWELIDSGRAEIATTWTQQFEDTGVFFTYLVCAPDDLASNTRLVDGVLRRVAQQGVEAAELEQAINKTTAGLILASDRPSSRMFTIGNHWLRSGLYLTLDQQLAAYRRVTRDDLARLAQEHRIADPTAQVETKP